MFFILFFISFYDKGTRGVFFYRELANFFFDETVNSTFIEQSVHILEMSVILCEMDQFCKESSQLGCGRIMQTLAIAVDNFKQVLIGSYLLNFGPLFS